MKFFHLHEMRTRCTWCMRCMRRAPRAQSPTRACVDGARARLCATQALSLDPDCADAWHSLGLVLKELGNLDGAIDAYRTALQLHPIHELALNHMGNALRERGQPAEALACYQRALQVAPGLAAAHCNYASLAREQHPQCLHVAVRHFFEALRLDPYFADAYAQLGATYREAGLFDEAIRMYGVAIALKPELAEVYAQLAATYKDTGRIREAIPHFRKALQLRPGAPDALCNLVHTLIFIADWSDYEQNMRLIEQSLDEQLRAGQLPAVQPFHAFVYPISLRKVKQLAVSYAQRAEQVAQALVQLRAPGAPAPPYAHPARDARLGTPGGARLRVGYVSSDFINHPLAHLMQSTFGFHDARRFEVFCY